MLKLLAAAAVAVSAVPLAAAEPAAASDYTQDAAWLCRPGRADVCSAAYTVATVADDGMVTTAALPAADARAPVDCFYVYPTVSTDPGGNSDMTADPAERDVARIQFAPFRQACRTYAPLYRQITLSALRKFLTGQPVEMDRELAYRDVVAAWHDYLARDNQGRGVILIGHSQGSNVLRRLIAEEIDGKPVAQRIVAAYIPGANLAVPAGAAVGGEFKATPLCAAATQTGCVVAYVSFRDGKLPPPESRFGRVDTAGQAAACVNPAALGGGRATLHPLLPMRSTVADMPAPTWLKGKTITADFVALPGLLTAECQAGANAHFLAVRTEADPADPRTDDVGGDVVAYGGVRPEWGLHLIDVSEALGDLVALAQSQAAAWVKAH